MTNVLYLGHFFTPELLRSLNYNSKGKIGFSNHNFEMSILGGLSQVEDICLKILTVPSVFSYPYNNRQLWTKKESYLLRNMEVSSVSFCNLPVIKELSTTWLCAIRILKLLNTFDNEMVNIIINTPSKRLLDAVKIVKKISKRRLTQTVIIPDIPAMVTAMDRSWWLKGWWLKKNNKAVMNLASESNGLVVLTEAMMDFFNPKPEHIVMEGLVDLDNMNRNIYTSHNLETRKEIVLYTGTLRKIFGVMNLVEALKYIPNSDFELWICGSGEASEDINQASKYDKRLKFFGLVSSEEALDLQQKSTILVNPRTSEGEFTKYSFPSKTMEYLLAGKSVVINKLPGIPNEYYQFVYTPQDESPVALAECLLKVINEPQLIRQNKAKEGRDFVINNKNSKIQANRIIDMIKSY